ncbi:MAG: efflux RND transporter periplasmic adaptor subunit [Gammaproteobacteria bacterium]|nr:efflux RND transporter periplasmic adaptor subunit [Gammaproteobacteria bacterium]
MLKSLYQKRSIIVASLIAISAVLWVMSGVVTDSDATQASVAELETHEPEMLVVSVEAREAQLTWRRFEGSGTIEAKRAVNVLSAQEGRVVAVNVTEGDLVTKGDRLIELSPKHIPQQRELAKAQLAQAELQYQSTAKLVKKGLQNQLRLAEAKSALESAKADLDAANVAVRELSLRAPFSASVQAVDMELGDYVRAGDRAVRLVQHDTLLAVVFVMADVAAELATGSQAEVISRTGQRYVGEITFVASEPDNVSRLYRVEAEIAQKGSQSGLVIGQPIEVKIPLQQVAAHRLPTSLLWLSPEGDMGVRAVAADNTVVFHKADFLRSEEGDLWLTGLPDSFSLIVAGQGLVRTGTTVNPQTVAATDQP